jgi:hypothetical protein
MLGECNVRSGIIAASIFGGPEKFFTITIASSVFLDPEIFYASIPES